MPQNYNECSCDFIIPTGILFFEWDQIYTDIPLASINKDESIQLLVEKIKAAIMKKYPLLSVTVEAKDVPWLKPRMSNFVPGISVLISLNEIDELADKLIEIMNEVYEEQKWIILLRTRLRVS